MDSDERFAGLLAIVLALSDAFPAPSCLQLDAALIEPSLFDGLTRRNHRNDLAIGSPPNESPAF